MNSKIFNLIQCLYKLSIGSHYPSSLKLKIIELNYMADEYNKSHTINLDIFQEIKKRIFNLLGIVPDCKNINLEFISTFSDLIIELIDEETRQEHDISDLVLAFNNISLSFNLGKSLSNMKI